MTRCQFQSTIQFNSAHPLESSRKNISTNYEHEVKILNVYPYNGNFLQNWMNKTDSSTGQKFSIKDTVKSRIDWFGTASLYLVNKKALILFFRAFL